MNDYYKKVCRLLTKSGFEKPDFAEVELFYNEGKSIHETAHVFALLSGRVLSSNMSELPF